jgi:DNA-binding protein H-NS
MVTLKDVQAKIAKLQAQAESIVAKQSSTIIAKIHGLMDEYGLTTADLERSGSNRKNSQANSTSKAKYQDPKTGATWSGHGRAPGWIASARNRDKFLVDGNAAAPAVKDKKAPKSGNYVRGPQPAMYRDPASGAEWSGRGRAPAWLASVKDRSKFLITNETGKKGAGKAVGKGTAKKPAATKASAKKKPAVKKAAAKKALTGKNAASNTFGSTASVAPSADEIVISQTA